jgi:hypothetical protein
MYVVEVTVVCVDNGEETLLRSLLSLRRQTVKPYIILCGGPKTNFELAGKLADKVLGPIEGIGKARVEGILQAETECIISCDGDSVYEQHFCQYALEDLKAGAKAVKAGVILPLKWDEPLTLLETAFSLIPCYEFALAFKKSEFLKLGLVEDAEQATDSRWDIGWRVVTGLNAMPDIRMVVYTRMPTKGAYEFSEKYLFSAVAGSTPILAVVTVPLVASVLK